MIRASHLVSASRRSVLVGAGAFALASGGGLALAQANGERKFVLVVLRGALDGLAAVAPVADPHYQAARPRLALTAAGALALSDGFVLHPRLTFLHESWTSGELAIVHAASSPYRERSHFEGQDVLESGGAALYGASDGWLNRALAALPGEGVSIGEAVPLVLRGSAPVTSWAPSVAPPASSDTLERLGDLYAGDALLAPALARAIETDALVGDAQMDGRGMRRRGPAAYNVLAEAAARFLAPQNSPCAAVLSFDGWDTHANQGGVDGALALRLAGLDTAMRTLKQGLGVHWEKTVVLVVTEFGRTVAENGTGGTDHGTGGAAFILGGAVRGGRFYGDWPGLSSRALYEGRDLAPANDLRSVFAAVLRDHWGLDAATLRSRVFPGASAPILQSLVA